MEKVTLNVEGMSCQHCVNAIESNVGSLSGVESVTVDLNKGEVEVFYNDEEVSPQAIADEIEEQGYDVK
ncbi:copper chaperone CopZ [Bacillus thermotolerans]|nr:copper chaperone CopZ [Bacillus thermotolerans]